MSSSFPNTSRYHHVDTTTHVTPDGREIVHLKRRVVPAGEDLALLREHRVVEGERPDHIAARHLGDAEQFWQVCDANDVLHPRELTATPGELLRITLPSGIPGTPYV